MAYAELNFVQPHSGRMKTAPVGFSWTTFFFGFFPALLRGHWIGAIIQVLLAFLTFGLSNLVFMFIYNKMYIKYLVGEGYRVQSSSGDVKFIGGQLQMQLPLFEG
jgi:hypothetical protein